MEVSGGTRGVGRGYRLRGAADNQGRHIQDREARLRGRHPLLLLGEMFHAVPEQPTDLIEGIVFVAAAAKGVLLHATPDLIDHLSP
jgi:hypothetical protein